MNFRKTLAAVAAAALLSVPAVSALADTTLRVTLQLPETHPLGVNLNAFKDIVEKETNGEVKVQIFPSAQLYKDKEVPQAVGSGAVEMGTASLTRFAGSVPAVDMFYLPFLFDTAEKVKKATDPDGPIRKKLDAAILEKTGARILWWQAFGRTIYLTKGDKAIKVPADAKGKKIRTFGKLLGWTAEAVGGSPTLMSGSKQFLAYQQGAVDAGITGLTGAKSRKLYEVMDHLTLTYDADIEFVAVINEETWQGLTPAQRDVITKAGRQVEQELRDKIFAIEADALKYLRGKINVVELSDADRQKWRDATTGVVNRFVDNAGPLGAELVKIAQGL